jgi:hypothetical protein
MRITSGMLLALLASAPLSAQARVATVDAIRLRGGPSATAAPVRTLDVATPLLVEGNAAAEWLRVRAADGARGWVRRDLTVPYDAANPLPALRRITERSLAQESAPFATRARLVNVLAGTSGATPAARAELALLRLRALQKALDEHASGGGGSGANPVRDGGIRADTSELAYGEPQGQWYVRADRFWALHDRNRALPIAESIAWHAANQQLPGECEGDATCIFGLGESTMGEYLARHPRGAHAPAALRELARLLAYVDEQSRGSPFCTRTGANYTIKPAQITALRRIVDASAGADRERASKLLQTLAGRCT